MVFVFPRWRSLTKCNNTLIRISIKRSSRYFFTVNKYLFTICSIKIIEDIDGIDSVYVDFISEKNEQALLNGYYYKTIDYNNIDATTALLNKVRENTEVPNLNTSTSIETNEKIVLKPGENPSLGLDDFGDIVIGKKELPIIRGGFEDRNGTEYVDGLNTDNLSALNIVIRDSIPRK